MNQEDATQTMWISKFRGKQTTDIKSFERSEDTGSKYIISFSANIKVDEANNAVSILEI